MLELTWPPGHELTDTIRGSICPLLCPRWGLKSTSSFHWNWRMVSEARRGCAQALHVQNGSRPRFQSHSEAQWPESFTSRLGHWVSWCLTSIECHGTSLVHINLSSMRLWWVGEDYGTFPRGHFVASSAFPFPYEIAHQILSSGCTLLGGGMLLLGKLPFRIVCPPLLIFFLRNLKKPLRNPRTPKNTIPSKETI